MFNGNVKIINASLKFLIKLPTQRAKFLVKSLLQSENPNQFQKLFKSALWCCFNIKLLKFFSTIFFFSYLFLFMWNMFLCVKFCSSCIWLDIQAQNMDLKTLRGHSNIKALGNLGTQRTRSLPLPKVCKKPTLPKPVPDVRYDLIDHFSEFIEKRVRCWFCPMENSYVICNKFRITLCFRKDQSCFYDFHH